MADNFIEPSTGKKVSSSEKKYDYQSYVNDRIISPYDGVIVSVDDRECDGNIKIKHFYNGKTFYTNLCGVGKTTYLSGQNVYKGKTIGFFGDKILNFSVLDKNGNKVSIKKILGDGFLSKGYEVSKGEKNDKSSTDRVAASVMADLIKLPLVGLEKFADFIKPKKKEKKINEPENEEPNDIVFEEIRRIKKLMK